MKTKSLFCAAMLVCSVLTAKAQWTGTNPIYTTNANVGIGTSTPGNALEVARTTPFAIGLNRISTTSQKSEVGFYKNSAVKWTIGTDMWDNNTNSFYIWNSTIGSPFYIAPNGNIGIGTTTPTARLDIQGGNLVLNDNNLFLRGNGNDPKHGLAYRNTFGGKPLDGPAIWGYGSGALGINTGSAEIISLYWSQAGVGIGTNCIPANTKLAVDGKIMCEEVTVKLSDANGCWPDYVFGKDFKLKPITEVEEYISKNNHLPDVPSASEVEENGISSSEMFKIQMQKIEELTLYLIEMKKENQELKSRITELEKSTK